LALQVSQLITRIEGLEEELSIAKQKRHDEINEEQVKKQLLETLRQFSSKTNCEKCFLELFDVLKALISKCYPHFR